MTPETVTTTEAATFLDITAARDMDLVPRAA